MSGQPRRITASNLSITRLDADGNPTDETTELQTGVLEFEQDERDPWEIPPLDVRIEFSMSSRANRRAAALIAGAPRWAAWHRWLWRIWLRRQR